MRDPHKPVTNLQGNAVIVRPMEESFRNAEWKQLDRRRGVVTLGHLVRTAAKKIRDNHIAEFQFPSPAQIRDACKRYHSTEHLQSCSKPKREVTSRGMAHRDHPAQIQIELGRD